MQGHTGAAATYRWAEPVFTLDGPRVSSGHRYRADSYSCHDFKAETPQTTITAGLLVRSGTRDTRKVRQPSREPPSLQVSPLIWRGPSKRGTRETALCTSRSTPRCAEASLRHHLCKLKLSMPPAQVNTPSNWIKLANFPGCIDQAKVDTFDGRAPDKDNEWTLTLPPWLPGSEHAVLRWEWTAVQQVNNIEFYVSCADVKIVGTAEAPDSSFLAKVMPLSTFTGTSHLPADAGAYRKVTGRHSFEPGTHRSTDRLTLCSLRALPGLQRRVRPRVHGWPCRGILQRRGRIALTFAAAVAAVTALALAAAAAAARVALSATSALTAARFALAAACRDARAPGAHGVGLVRDRRHHSPATRRIHRCSPLQFNSPCALPVLSLCSPCDLPVISL